jgi:hypothetical protein
VPRQRRVSRWRLDVERMVAAIMIVVAVSLVDILSQRLRRLFVWAIGSGL